MERTKRFIGIFMSAAILLTMFSAVPAFAADTLTTSDAQPFEMTKFGYDFDSQDYSPGGTLGMTCTTETVDGSKVHKYASDNTTSKGTTEALYNVKNLSNYSSMLDATCTVTSYDIKFDEIHINEAESDKGFLTFMVRDDDGSGTDTDYNPSIPAVKAIYNANGAATLKTANDKTVDYNKWYTFFMVSRIVPAEGSNKTRVEATLFYEEKGTNSPVLVGSQTRNLSRDGIISHIYVFVQNSSFDTTKSSVFYVDNIFYKKSIAAENETPFTNVYGKGDTFSANMFIQPGFTEASVSFAGKTATLTDNGTGYYNITRTMTELNGNIDLPFEITANYDGVYTYYKKMVSFIENKVMLSPGAAYAEGIVLDNEIKHMGEKIGTAATDPLDQNNNVRVVSTTTNDEHQQRVVENANRCTTTAVGGMDFYLEKIVSNGNEENLMSLSAKANSSDWLASITLLKVSKDGDNTVIKTVTGKIIEQQKWYTVYGVFNHEKSPDGNRYWTAYIKEKGAADETAIELGVAKNPTGNVPVILYLSVSKAGLDVANENKPVYYLDNAFLKAAISVETDTTKRMYSTEDTFNINTFIQPGFTEATIALGKEEQRLTDNGVGYYAISKSLSDFDNGCIVPLIITATYGGAKTVISRTVMIAREKYSYLKLDDKEMNFDLSSLKVDSTDIPADSSSNIKSVTDSFPYIKYEGAGVFDVAEGRNGSGDRALQLQLESTDKGLSLGYYRTASAFADYKDGCFVKASIDLKFNTEDFYVGMSNKTDGAWASPDTVYFIHKDTAPYFNTDIYVGKKKVEKNKWYTFTIIYDTVNNTADLFVDNIYICSQSYSALGIIDVMYLTVTTKVASTETDPQIVTADNFKVEVSPYRYTGIKDAGFEEADVYTATDGVIPAGAAAAKLQFNTNSGIGLSAKAVYSDGTSAGDAVVDSFGGYVKLTAPSGGFNCMKDIKLQLLDETTNEVISEKVFITKNNDGVAISDISNEKNGTDVEVSVYAVADEPTDAGYLYIVGYNEEGTRVTDVNLEKISATTEKTKFSTKITGGKGFTYRAFVWNNKFVPVKEFVEIND